MRRLLWAFLMLAVVAGGGFLVGRDLLHRWMAAPGPLMVAAVVDIPRGTGLDGIADRLARAGAIDGTWRFRLAARLLGRDRGLEAGEYELTAHISPEALFRMLEQGDVLLHRVVVPEGLTTHEVYELLKHAEVLSGDLPPAPGEGALLPETYLVPRGTSRASIVQRMTEAARGELERLWPGRAEGLPLTSPEEALVLASIIEKETALASEYPLVAAVFVNRLRRGMRLQTDPSVIYALSEGKGGLGRPLTREDLAVAHPFNTYQVAGLPPGPICNPGRPATAAALQPAEVDYLYFVADGAGGHAFAATLDEHNRNVRRWRKVRDGQAVTP